MKSPAITIIANALKPDSEPMLDNAQWNEVLFYAREVGLEFLEAPTHKVLENRAAISAQVSLARSGNYLAFQVLAEITAMRLYECEDVPPDMIELLIDFLHDRMDRPKKRKPTNSRGLFSRNLKLFEAVEALAKTGIPYEKAYVELATYQREKRNSPNNVVSIKALHLQMRRHLRKIGCI